MGRQKINILRYAVLICMLWTISIGAILLWNFGNLRDETNEIALNEARTYFNKDQAFRFWATSHGGVYVPPTERTPPSPFLSHLPERDIVTPSGRELTLMNPAYMLRQVMEEYSDLYGVKGHITSLKPLRPENAPDEWEKEALERFELGEEEVVEISGIQGEPFLRLMRPMIAEEGCLRCHGSQGYKAGDVRGGVSVSVPLAPILAIERTNARSLLLTHLLVWTVGLAGIIQSGRSIAKKIKEREAAQEEARQWMNAFQNAKWGVVIGSADGKTLERMNPEFAAMHGYTVEELAGRPILDLIAPRSRAEVPEIIKAAHKKGHHVFESTHLRKDGTEFPVLVDVTAVKEAKGDVKYHVVNVQDITERRKTEKAIARSEAFLSNVIDGVAEPIMVISTDYSIRMMNREAKKFLPDAGGGIVPKYCYMVSHNMNSPCSGEDHDCPMQEVLRTGKPYSVVHTHVDRNGNDRLIEIIASPLFNPDGSIDGIVESSRDITERRKATEELENIFALSSDLICVASMTHFLKVNPSAGKILGYSEEELLMVPFIELIHPDDIEPTRLKIEEHLKKGIPAINFVNRYRHRDGHYVWLEWMTNAIPEKGLLYGVARDITERKKTTEELENIFSLSSDLICIASTTHFLKTSPSFELTLGYSGEELLGRPFMEFVHPDDVGPTADIVREKLKKGKPAISFVNRYRHKDGHYVWLEWVTTPVLEEGLLYAVARDITERVASEEALRLKAQILEQVHDSVIVTDMDGVIIGWNKGAEKIYGYPAGEAIGRHISIVYPEDRRRFLLEEIIVPLKEKGHLEIQEDMCITKSGEIIYTHLSLSIVRDFQDKPVNMIGYSIDITEGKLARNAVEKSLKEKEVLLREVHHRVKNNMAVISALLNMQSAYVRDAEDLEMFRDSQSRIRSMALVHEKLYKTRDFANINVREYIQSLAEDIGQTFSGKRRVDAILDVEDTDIDIDVLIPCGLIINELLTNSYKHAFGSVENPLVSIRLEPIDGDIRLTISDNGVGLPEGFDIYNPTGLGYKLVRALCDQIKGTYFHKPGNGTTFVLIFPKAIKIARG